MNKQLSCVKISHHHIFKGFNILGILIFWDHFKKAYFQKTVLYVSKSSERCLQDIFSGLYSPIYLNAVSVCVSVQLLVIWL